MAGMIEPRHLIITTLSFLSGYKGDVDHSPARRGRHSNGAQTGQMVHRSGGAGKRRLSANGDQPATSSSRAASSLGWVMYGRCELAILRDCHPAASLAAPA